MGKRGARLAAIRGRLGGRLRLMPLFLAGALAVSAAACMRDPLEFSPTTLPDAQVGMPYTVTVTVTHAATPVGGVSVQDGSLPPGIDVSLGEGHDSTFRIAGLPTAAGSYSFSVYVWCYGTNVAGQTATQAYTLVVK